MAKSRLKLASTANWRKQRELILCTAEYDALYFMLACVFHCFLWICEGWVSCKERLHLGFMEKICNALSLQRKLLTVACETLLTRHKGSEIDRVSFRAAMLSNKNLAEILP